MSIRDSTNSLFLPTRPPAKSGRDPLKFPPAPIPCAPSLAPCGELAQLVERYNGIVEVRGSTPLLSTIFGARATWVSRHAPPRESELRAKQIELGTHSFRDFPDENRDALDETAIASPPGLCPASHDLSTSLPIPRLRSHLAPGRASTDDGSSMEPQLLWQRSKVRKPHWLDSRIGGR